MSKKDAKVSEAQLPVPPRVEQFMGATEQQQKQGANVGVVPRILSVCHQKGKKVKFRAEQTHYAPIQRVGNQSRTMPQN